MSDRQLFQLNARVPALTDVIGTQDAAGALEQGKSTLQQVKDLLIVPSTIKKFTIRFTCISNAFSAYTIIETDFPGLTITSIFKPAVDQIAITIDQNLYNDATKTKFQLNTNGTLFIRPEIANAAQIILFMAEHDGTPPPSVLPNFINFFITVTIYP